MPPSPVLVPAPPAPRPDPYSQIANPLHSDWGQQPTPPPAAAPPPVQARRSGRRSPWRRAGVTLVVIVVAAGAAWLAREPIGDAATAVKERIERFVEDGSDEGAAALRGDGDQA